MPGPVSGPIALMDVDVLRSLLGTHAGDLESEAGGCRGNPHSGALDLGCAGKGRHLNVCRFDLGRAEKAMELFLLFYIF